MLKDVKEREDLLKCFGWYLADRFWPGMNPIIFIDELDKVSQTEHGRDIVSILTHLTDPAQNEEFQDKYYKISSKHP